MYYCLYLRSPYFLLIFFYLNITYGCSLGLCKGRSVKAFLKPDNFSELQATDSVLVLRFFNSPVLVMINMVACILVAKPEILSF